MYRKIGHKSAMSEGDATVVSFRVIIRDGWYNAFTDLTLWKNYWWLGYRRGTGHGEVLSVNAVDKWGGLKIPSTSNGNTFAVVLRSTDLLRWHESKIFEPPGGIVDRSGIGSPHFCTTNNRLYAFIGVETPREHGIFNRIYCTWTENGIEWTKPEVVVMGDTYPFTFRVRYYQNRFYSVINANNRTEGVLDLVTSEDGINWSIHSQITSDHEFEYTEETDVHWLPDGEMWTVIRTNSGAVFSSSKPPYNNWSKIIDLGNRCDAPVMCTSGNTVYLAGRVEAPGDPPGILGAGTTGLYELTYGKTKLLLTFPPGADAAYAGLVSPKPGKLILSTYSDAAYSSDTIKPKHFSEYMYKKTESDIYIAEINI